MSRATTDLADMAGALTRYARANWALVALLVGAAFVAYKFATDARLCEKKLHAIPVQAPPPPPPPPTEHYTDPKRKGGQPKAQEDELVKGKAAVQFKRR